MPVLIATKIALVAHFHEGKWRDEMSGEIPQMLGVVLFSQRTPFKHCETCNDFFQGVDGLGAGVGDTSLLYFIHTPTYLIHYTFYTVYTNTSPSTKVNFYYFKFLCHIFHPFQLNPKGQNAN